MAAGDQGNYWGVAMRRLGIALLVGWGFGFVIFRARYASYELVYRYIRDEELEHLYCLPHSTTFSEVREHFGEVVEHLSSTPPSLLYPVAKVVGLIETPTILAASLLFAIASCRWTSVRQPKKPSQTPLTKD